MTRPDSLPLPKQKLSPEPSGRGVEEGVVSPFRGLVDGMRLLADCVPLQPHKDGFRFLGAMMLFSKWFEPS